MVKFLYRYIKWLMEKEGFEAKYYSFYTPTLLQQLVNAEMVDFPAVLFEVKNIQNNYTSGGDRSKRGTLVFTLHLFTQSYGVIRDGDETEDRVLEHYDYQTELIKCIDSSSTERDKNDYDIDENQHKYIIGVIDQVRMINQPTIKSVYHTIIEFQAPFIDFSLTPDDLLREYTIISVSGSTSNFDSMFELGIV